MRFTLRTCAVLMLSLIFILALAGCGSQRQPVTAASLYVINVTGTSTAALQRGQTVQLVAIGLFTDGLGRVLSDVAWNSSDTSVASVSSGGLVTAVSRGTADISATLGLSRGTAVSR